MMVHTCARQGNLSLMLIHVSETLRTVSHWTSPGSNRYSGYIHESNSFLMSAITRVFPVEFRERLVHLALDGLSSPSTLRAYSAAIDEFLTWAPYQPAPEFSKALVQQYKSMLIEKELAPSTINQRLAAVRRLTTEAADNGLLDPAVAAAIARVHGLKCSGVRLGNWLDEQHAAALLITPAADSLRGRRDRAVLALLFGTGMRRSEVAGVVVEKLRVIEERWVIADLTGKGRRIRTVPVPTWAMAVLNDWLDVAGITAGSVFRPIDKRSQAPWLAGTGWDSRLRAPTVTGSTSSDLSSAASSGMWSWTLQIARGSHVCKRFRPTRSRSEAHVRAYSILGSLPCCKQPLTSKSTQLSSRRHSSRTGAPRPNGRFARSPA